MRARWQSRSTLYRKNSFAVAYKVLIWRSGVPLQQQEQQSDDPWEQAQQEQERYDQLRRKQFEDSDRRREVLAGTRGRQQPYSRKHETDFTPFKVGSNMSSLLVSFMFSNI